VSIAVMETCVSVSGVATANGLFLADGQNQGPVQRERGNGCSPGCRARHDSFAVPGEMIRPGLRSGVEQWRLFTRLRIDRGQLGPLSERARNAGESEIISVGRSVGRARYDVIDVERGLLADL